MIENFKIKTIQLENILSEKNYNFSFIFVIIYSVLKSYFKWVDNLQVQTY